jgi:DNA-binding GntR family transcriptional regulator
MRDGTNNGGEGGVRRGSGAAAVYEALKREILSLDLAPGAVLDEADLARRFGVSRSPVREALIRLSGHRLVTSLPNRPTAVAPIDLYALKGHLDAVQLLYRVTCRMAACRRAPRDVAALNDLQEAHDAATRKGDLAAIVQGNRAFHTEVARIAGNAHYLTWQAGLLEEGERYMHLCIRQLGWPGEDTLGGGHRAIILAIEAGDASAADRAGAEDAAIFRRALLTLFDDLPSAGLAL